MTRRERPPCAVGIEAKSCQKSGPKRSLLILDPRQEQLPLAATNKCLAESNKSHTGGNDY